MHMLQLSQLSPAHQQKFHISFNCCWLSVCLYDNNQFALRYERVKAKFRQFHSRLQQERLKKLTSLQAANRTERGVKAKTKISELDLCDVKQTIKLKLVKLSG